LTDEAMRARAREIAASEPNANRAERLEIAIIEVQNEGFKQGRRAGQEDVSKAILSESPHQSHRIAREFLEGAAPSPAPRLIEAPKEGSAHDRVAWTILTALHENISEDQRPMSWSDLNQDHEKRIRAAADAAIFTMLHGATPAPAAKGGEWQMVPKQLPSGMIEAGWKHVNRALSEGNNPALLALWDALLAAAPPAPSETEREVERLRKIVADDGVEKDRLFAVARQGERECAKLEARVRVLEEENAKLWRAVKAWEAESLEGANEKAPASRS
jgi:hypothetical protein